MSATWLNALYNAISNLRLVVIQTDKKTFLRIENQQYFV